VNFSFTSCLDLLKLIFEGEKFKHFNSAINQKFILIAIEETGHQNSRYEIIQSVSRILVS